MNYDILDSPAARACGQDITSNRHGGNPQSVKAFEKIKEGMPKKRRAILDSVTSLNGGNGVTAKEVKNALGVELNTISGRFTELKRDGLIHQIGVRDGCAIYVAS